MVHTDLPENDFTVLFQTLTASPKCYLRNNPAVFASAVGKSFYEQILPSNSLTLGWSSWAVQWLSRTPAVIPDHVQLALSQDLPAQNAFSHYERADSPRDKAQPESMRERLTIKWSRCIKVGLA